MLRCTDGSVKSWQRPGLRHRLVFAILSVLIALSYALLFHGEEAQAKGGKQSPNGGSTKGDIGGSAKPAREAVGEVNKLASNEGSGGKDVGSLAAKDPAPRADKPAPVENGTVRDAARSTTEQVADKAPSVVAPLPETNPPIVERAGSRVEVAGTAREVNMLAIEPVLEEKSTSVTGPSLEGETKLPRAEPILEEATMGLPKAEPILEETTKPEIEPVLNRATSETVPILEGATSPVRPVLEETTSAVEPLLDTASSKIKPVLEGATAPVSPVIESTASTVEPLLGEANSPVGPALAETLPAIDPTLNGAVPAADEPVGEANGPVSQPLGEEAIQFAGPALEDAASPGVGPIIEAAAPVFESVFEPVAPVVRSGLGERVVHQSTGPTELEGNADAISASLPTLQSHALATEAQVPLGSARNYGPVRDEPQASAVEPPAAHSRLFDRSFVIDGSQAALLGALTAEDAREGPPRPFPFGFPPVAPPVGISFGSSGTGVALALLAILALLPILRRVGGSSWSSHAAFKLGSPTRLAIERPG